MNSCVFRTSLRVGSCCLSLGLLAVMAGCTKNPHSTQHAEVSGKVLYEGKPLPGGQVNFVSLKDGFASKGTIDENGNYTIEAPVGEVAIGVDNSMLAVQRGAPKQMMHPKRPDSEEEAPIKGRYVNIPLSYADPQESGLKYTVTPGPQTHNIELTNKPTPPPGASGQ